MHGTLEKIVDIGYRSPRYGFERMAGKVKRKKCGDWDLISDTTKLEEMRVEMGLDLWDIVEDDKKGMNILKRSFTAMGFQDALNFINGAGVVAENRGHHPDLHLTGYRNVCIEIFTHSLSGLTENDFLLAKEIDAVKISYSPKWLKENPHASKSELSSSLE
jgi:4a-hydroxytetrahydrobiopterin dehydratase